MAQKFLKEVRARCGGHSTSGSRVHHACAACARHEQHGRRHPCTPPLLPLWRAVWHCVDVLCWLRARNTNTHTRTHPCRAQVDVLPDMLRTIVGMCKLFHLHVTEASKRFLEQVRGGKGAGGAPPAWHMWRPGLLLLMPLLHGARRRHMLPTACLPAPSPLT